MPEIHLNGPIGRLEARYTHNNEANSPSVLILHAHPGHGGNMNNPLSLQLHKFFSDLGFSSLRFNFRGVGKSDGEHDGSEGELADSAIALDWLQNQNQESNQYWVCGISFGAWVGMQLLMRRPEIPKFVLISPPVGAIASLIILLSCLFVIFIALLSLHQFNKGKARLIFWWSSESVQIMSLHSHFSAMIP